VHAVATGDTAVRAVAVGASQAVPDPVEEAARRLVQLRTDDDERFLARFKELSGLASQDAAAAAGLLDRVIAEYRDILYSAAPAAHRVRALRRLRLAAEKAGSDTAAQVISAFERAYDELKKDVVTSDWWLRGEGAPPKDAERWILQGLVLAAAGDRPATLDQAFALAQGRALKQDRAKSVELYLHVIESSKATHPFSTKLRQAGVRGLAATLNTVVMQKDQAAATRLEPVLARRATAGASDMQYYLGLFSECVRQPPDLDGARKWYSRAAADANWKPTAEQKLQVLGQWCPGEAG
jgi:hypothetical protein